MVQRNPAFRLDKVAADTIAAVGILGDVEPDFDTFDSSIFFQREVMFLFFLTHFVIPPRERHGRITLSLLIQITEKASSLSL